VDYSLSAGTHQDGRIVRTNHFFVRYSRSPLIPIRLGSRFAERLNDASGVLDRLLK